MSASIKINMLDFFLLLLFIWMGRFFIASRTQCCLFGVLTLSYRFDSGDGDMRMNLSNYYQDIFFI